MLGIRHYKQVAVDLYQRDLSHDIADFVCDVMVRVSIPTLIQEVLTQAGQAKQRHIVLVPEPASALLQSAAEAMAIIKNYIDQESQPGHQVKHSIWPKRITLMFDDKSSHDYFQDALFKTFPEIDAHE